jgi:hypothetical protein
MQLPHYVLVDLYDNGIGHEVIVMKQDKSNGDFYYIKVESLDDVDRKRLQTILSRREAPNMELWDLMSNITLGNGVNALEYFHQLVKIKTRSGKHISPSSGRRGMAVAIAPEKSQFAETPAPQAEAAPAAKAKKVKAAPEAQG